MFDKVLVRRKISRNFDPSKDGYSSNGIMSLLLLYITIVAMSKIT